MIVAESMFLLFYRTKDIPFNLLKMCIIMVLNGIEKS
jgi:hypothetical protein